MAYFHCLIGGGSSGGGYELTVTCDADFAGTTITCADGVTTLTQTCPSASPYEVVFAIPNGGEWTISGTISGQTYSASIDIPDSLELHSIPEGSTVLPTDDIQIWLKCAGITDKSYTTLNEVLADSTTLLALMSNNNAVDYLVRSTTWASGITADSTAMTDIGANNYCANTLLADSTWFDAICNSTYLESVLNVKVPTMTSNNTPEGECFSGSNYSASFPPYKAFDGNIDNAWLWGPIGTTNNYVGYKFPSTRKVYAMKATFAREGNPVNATVKIQGSVNGIDNYVDLATFDTSSFVIGQYNDITVLIDNPSNYLSYRLFSSSAMLQGSGLGFSPKDIQFYGREDV